jgi:hypothetical protein
MGARILRVWVVASVGALALPVAALAAVRFKVLADDVYQETTWTSNSSSDNGCYTGSFVDSGSTKVFMTPKRGAIVKAVPSGDPSLGMVLKGFKFSGIVHQEGNFTDNWTLDQNASPAQCGPPTGPGYEPVSTADCGTKDISASNSNLELTIPLGNSPRQPAALVGTFYAEDPFSNCPSDDPGYAATPLFVRAKQPPSVFRNRVIVLEGDLAKRGSGGMYYRGYNDQSGDALRKIHWRLKLKRIN